MDASDLCNTTTTTTPTLADAFVRLPSPDSRRNALLALLPHLSAHEWRWLHSTTAARTFDCDIIARLPLELAAHVFSHLDPAAPFRLAHVSRRWNHVLRSPPLLTRSLHAWYHATLPLHAADYDVCRRHARLANAFRHATAPLRCFAINDLALSDPHEPLLVHDTLIWRGRGNRHLYLLNMSTWSLRAPTSPGRGTISHVCASTHLVAWTTNSSTCHIESLDGNAPSKSFKVANPALFRALDCRQRTVACAGFIDDHAVVYIWNFDTQQGTSFDISLQSHLFLHTTPGPPAARPALRLLLQPDTSTIVVFVTGLDGHGPAHVRHARYAYNGECLSSSTILIHGLDRASLFDNETSQLTPVGHDHVFSLSLVACESGKHPNPQVFKLQFDEQLNQFTSPYHAMSEKGRLWVHSSFGWWNDTFYESLSRISGCRQPTPVTGHVGTRYAIVKYPFHQASKAEYEQ
jgi:hypothetical protein